MLGLCLLFLRWKARGMNRFQMATLVGWAGQLHTRKRLQKIVFLLQAGGCDLGVQYTLHHYGPYSADVASLTDEMVRAELLLEEETRNVMGGRSYSYTLPEHVKTELAQLKGSPRYNMLLGELGKFEAVAQRLLGEHDLKKLELAATVAYFQARTETHDWANAHREAAQFKHQDVDNDAMKSAEQFAREIVEQG